MVATREPDSVEQDEYEQRTGLAFQVERSAKAVATCCGPCVSCRVTPRPLADAKIRVDDLLA